MANQFDHFVLAHITSNLHVVLWFEDLTLQILVVRDPQQTIPVYLPFCQPEDFTSGQNCHPLFLIGASCFLPSIAAIQCRSFLHRFIFQDS